MKLHARWHAPVRLLGGGDAAGPRGASPNLIFLHDFYMIFTWFLHDFQGRSSQKGAAVLFIGTEERALAAMLGLWFMHVAFCLCCTCIYRDNTRLAPGYMWRNYTTCNYAAYSQLQWKWERQWKLHGATDDKTVWGTDDKTERRKLHGVWSLQWTSRLSDQSTAGG